jgi:uncharacterized protein YjbJ (UPF0337 family)
MKAILWIIAGVGVGLAAYVVLNQPGLQYASGNDGIENAADKTAFWGSKQRISGVGKGVVGKLKEGVGKVTGDDGLAGEGVTDQVAGTIKDAAGKAAHAVGETIHDLNR